MEKDKVIAVDDYRQAIIILIKMINDPGKLKKIYDFTSYYSKKD